MGFNIYSNKITPVKRYIYRENQKYNRGGTSALKAPYGDNLFAIIEREKTVRDYLIAHLVDYNFKLRIDRKNNKVKLFTDLEEYFDFELPFSALPDTFRQTLFYIAAARTNYNSILLLEDPDVHAFPKNIHDIAEAFIETSTNQYFIATHNLYLITKLLEDVPNEDLKVFYVYHQNRETKVTELADDAISDLLFLGDNLFWNLERYEEGYNEDE